MGDVYAAHDPRLARRVAVKLVRTRAQDGPPDADARMRLLREAQAIAKLSHPNVVVVHDVGTYRDNVFVAMEFVEGMTVTAWLLAEQRTPAAILALYALAARGLEAAHRAGLVHRDFKPDNVMVGRDGQVRVMDFGLARQVVRVRDDQPRPAPDGGAPPVALGPLDVAATVRLSAPAADEPPDSEPILADKLTQTGAIMGTPAYMAPEQFLGRATDARTDQFSFCVALYEALYGERPFGGNTVLALTNNVLAGTVSDPPPETRVSAALRRVLLRGLSLEPAARWPSMTALLDALADDPSKGLRRRWAVAGVALGAVLVGASAAASWRLAHAPSRICRAGDEKLAGVWEADQSETARKARIKQAFDRTARPFAAGAFAGVQRILDRYAADWKRMYAETCEATNVRGDQSADVMDLRMACLEGRLRQLRALGDVLVEADTAVVENAAAAASNLPTLERCADVALLQNVVAPPEGPAAQARVAELRRQIARVEATGTAGPCAPRVEAGRQLLAAARALDYAPLEAEALDAAARSEASCLEPAEVVQLSKRALRAAIASRDEEAAVPPALFTARVLAELDTADEARDWLELARALLRSSRGNHPLLEWRVLATEGLVSAREGNTTAALDQLQRALALGQTALGADDIEIAGAQASVGAALESEGRVEESITYFDRARRIAIQLLGPDHPQVALYLAARSEALIRLGRYAESLDDARRAVEIWKKAGASHALLSTGLTRVGEGLLGAGRRDEALPVLEEALRLEGEGRAPASPDTRFALAQALWPAAPQRARAMVFAEGARAEYEQRGADASRRTQVVAWLKAHAAP
jgi:tetratricopeptide (TPR) repeat protein